MTANSFVATASIGGLAFLAWVCPVTCAQARITEVVITATESPAFAGQSFGTVGPYERISGHLVGEVDPKDPRNAIIVDLDLAPRNARGMVSYSAEFQLLRPVARGKTSRLLFEITNRGRTNALELLNDSKTANDVTTAGDPGNGFLMRAGYALLEIGADVTAPHNGKLFSATAPIARNPDGSSIMGLAVEEFVIDKNADAGAAAAHLSGCKSRQVAGKSHGAQELRRHADTGPGGGLGLCRCQAQQRETDVRQFRRAGIIWADGALRVHLRGEGPDRGRAQLCGDP